MSTTSRFDYYQRAHAAIDKATRLWPGVHAQVLADEIHAGTHLFWLGPNTRTQRLINYILDLPETTDTETPS